MFRASGSFDGEARLAHADGRVFWGRLRGRAVRPGDVGAGTIWIIEDITHAREEHEKLAWAAEHDALTGLVNRGGFEIRLKRAHDEREGFCALFVDLDRFKQVNDTAGHAAGDRMLADLARLIGEPVRDSDTVARLGGDEFALLLPGCPPARAMAIADQIRVHVEAYRLHWDGVAHGVGASIGVVHDDGAFETSADVIEAADAACYAAKRSGRNRVVQWCRESSLATAA
jgi:diguanylate cyclase (GGDEF)-like protein